MRTLSFSLLAVIGAGAPIVATAQERPTAAVLETQAEGVAADTAGAIDRMIRARLDGLEVVRTSSGVALDLSEVQLALGCVGETPECLRPVADELSVQLLLIPHLDETDGRVMLTIALYDREQATIQRVVREASGERARTDILDAIEGQLRELFGLPPPDPGSVVTPPGGPPVAPSAGPSAGSFIVMGIGVAALAVGIGLGVAALDAESEYVALDPTSEQEALDADAAYQRWETFAITADVLFVVGGVAAAGGLAWLLVELLAPQGQSTTAVAPVLGPDLAGLTVSGTWGVR